MSPSILLENLTARGARIRAEGDQLKVNAPAGVLTDQDKAALRAHKPEILRLLTGQASPLIASDPCPSCGGACVVESGDRWKHSYCPAGGHYDKWEATAGGKLKDTPLFKETTR